MPQARAWAVIVALVLLVACSGGSTEAEDADSPASSTTTAPTSDPSAVRVVTLNLLHGLFSPEETDSCQAPDRVAIFAEHVEEADCPDLIGLQEVGPRFVGMDTERGPGFDSRIDQVLVRTGAECDARIEAESFAAEPAASPRNGMWWPADHAGVEATVTCT